MAGLAPPGWYADPGGTLRWWDGAGWGPPAPGPSDTETGRTLAILAHLGFFLGAFVLPLVIRLVDGGRNPYVKHHATEALNFQITFLICWVLGVAGIALAPVLTGHGRSHSGFALLVAFPLVMFALVTVNIALSIVGAVRASQQRWWRYPVCLRLVKGT